MKIRQGFVSNSSSSSFVAIAFNMKDHEEKFSRITWEDMRKNNFSQFNGEEDGVPEGERYVGVFLADQIEDYEWNAVQLKLKDIQKKANRIRKHLDLPEDMEWEIIVGVRCS